MSLFVVAVGEFAQDIPYIHFNSPESKIFSFSLVIFQKSRFNYWNQEIYLTLLDFFNIPVAAIAKILVSLFLQHANRGKYKVSEMSKPFSLLTVKEFFLSSADSLTSQL